MNHALEKKKSLLKMGRSQRTAIRQKENLRLKLKRVSLTCLYHLSMGLEALV